jgi:hypothetical protein
MPPLQTLTALAAAPDMHVEATLNRFLWKLDLILRSDVRLADIVGLAVRATLGQRNVDGLVELLLSLHRSPRMLAVVVPGLTPRPLRL